MVTSKDSLFHHHHPNFYDFFPRAIAPFTGNKRSLEVSKFLKKSISLLTNDIIFGLSWVLTVLRIVMMIMMVITMVMIMNCKSKWRSGM